MKKLALMTATFFCSMHLCFALTKEDKLALDDFFKKAKVFHKDDVNFQFSDCGTTALLEAVSLDYTVNTNAIEPLLKAGADPNIQNFKKETPMHKAIFYNKIKAMHLLVKYGANPNTQCLIGTTDGVTALIRIALEKENIGNEDEPFILETVDLILKSGADPNIQDEEGWTALHCAAYSGNLEVAKRLVQYRANLNIQAKKFDWTPLHCAAYAGNLEVVKFLVESGAKRNIKTKEWRQTPIDIANERWKSKVVRYLKSVGCKKRLLIKRFWDVSKEILKEQKKT